MKKTQNYIRGDDSAVPARGTAGPISLTLPEPPSGNRFWRHAKGRTYLSLDAVAYRLKVLAACKKAKVKPLSGPVIVTYHWYRGRASGDLDNRSKQLLDALQDHAYTNDSQIVELHAYRHDRKGDPGVTVTIEAAPQPES